MRRQITGVGDWKVDRRVEKLKRLLAIRRLSEDLDRSALRGVLASVTEAETSLTAQREALLEAGQETRNALAIGERVEWLLSVAKREVTAGNIDRATFLLNERRAVADSAMKQ